MISRFDYKTPGREDILDSNDASPSLKESSEGTGTVASQVIAGLGGADNIVELDCCATRLRITVKDPLKVLKNTLENTGAKGVIVKNNGIQVIYGPGVSVLKNEIEEILDN